MTPLHTPLPINLCRHFGKKQAQKPQSGAALVNLFLLAQGSNRKS